MAHISRWALAVFLGLQQGAPREAAEKNGLFLCKLQEGSGDLWRGSQTGVWEAGKGAGRVLRPGLSQGGRLSSIPNGRPLGRVLT